MEIRKRKPIGKKNIKYIEELYAEYSKRLFFIARKYVENEILQKMLYRVHLRKC